MVRKKLPDPLDFDFTRGNYALRILSDRGIKQAIGQGYIGVSPAIDLDNPGKRIQPATIDLGFDNVEESYSRSFADDGELHCSCKQLEAGKVSLVKFKEEFVFNSPAVSIPGLLGGATKQPTGFFDGFIDGRSSLLRLGAVVLGRPAFLGNVETTMFNLSPNDIVLNESERIAQMFIEVKPFADCRGVPYSRGGHPHLSPEGDKIRELEMGVQVVSNFQLEALSEAGLIKIERGNGGRYVPWKGVVFLHANRAYRARKIESGVDFANRTKYKKEDLLEEININGRYFLREGERLVVGADEKFELSPYAGFRIVNFFVGADEFGTKLFGNFPRPKLSQIKSEEDFCQAINDYTLYCTSNGWIDPGYKGIVSGFPRYYSGKSIQKGDVVGYAQVFYFPKGVERPYGSEELGSQYQGLKELSLGKR